MAYTHLKLLLFAFLLIQVIITSSLAQTKNGIVPLGSIISANETGNPWLSPSGDFAFGFQPTPGQDLYYLCVWYNRIPEQTLAWYLGADGHGPVPKGSTVTLDAQYGLVLNDPQGKLIWTSSVDNTDHGYMNDTGNFVLFSRDKVRLWQTFYMAIDTILPLQGLIFGSKLNSRKSYSNVSQPIYYLVFQKDGDFTLSTSPDNNDQGAIYYNSHTSDPKNPSNSAYILSFNVQGYLSVTRNNNQATDISSRKVPPASENYYKATINTDGVFALSYHPRNFTISPGWTDVWTAPENICMINNGSGLCGHNSKCTLVKLRPVCQYSQVLEPSPEPSPKPSTKPSPEPSPSVVCKPSPAVKWVIVLSVLLGSSVA